MAKNTELESKTEQYRLLTGRHSMGGKVYVANTEDNILTLTEEQAKIFDKGRLEPAEGGKASKLEGSKGALIDRLSSLSEDQLAALVKMLDEEGNKKENIVEKIDTEADTDIIINQDNEDEIDIEALLSGSIPEIKNKVRKIKSIDDLDAIYQAESGGRQRTGVFTLLLDRKTELEEK
jgi:hypothetical protein